MSGQLKEQVERAVEQAIEGTDRFLVDVKISPSKISVSIDKPAGITLSECIDLTRCLHKELDETGVFDKHDLEVSSPGMEEPLKVFQQYQKRIGREVRVLISTGMVKTGILKSVNAEALELEEKIERKVSGKKTVEINSITIPFSTIKETTIIFNFKN